jgi:hypothetical protein
MFPSQKKKKTFSVIFFFFFAFHICFSFIGFIFSDFDTILKLSF